MYVLGEDGTPIACGDDEYDKWSAFLWSMNGTGRLDQFAGVTVSTCFMGLELRRDDEPRGEPLLWETMIRQDGRCEPVSIERHPNARIALGWHEHVLAVLKRHLVEPEQIPS